MPLPSKHLLVFVASLLVFSAAIFADDLPSSDEINLLAQKAKQAADDFYKQTFEIRMSYEYSGRFIDSNGKVKILELAAQATAGLEQIAGDQNNLLKQIEDYQGDDWEIRFGQTGLWRRLTADLKKTESEALEINTVSAIAGGAKSDCPPLAIRSGCNSVRQALEKIKCLGRCEPNELETIAEALAKSECNNNPEMLLLLAILQNKYTPDKLKNTISHYPRAGEMLGKIILDCLKSDPNLDSLNPVTAELAAATAWKNNPTAYKDLLLAMAGDEKLKTPGTLAIAGIAVTESDPQTAVKFLMESSILQSRQKETLLDIDARATSEHAARLAYDNFTKQNIDCNLAVAAFEHYADIVSDKLTAEMQYLYGEILLDCGNTRNAVEIFTKLTSTSRSIWRDKATLQLLKIHINDGQSEESLPQLRKFILNCTGRDRLKDRLRFEAMDLYCQTALASDSNDAARQVLDILDSAEPTRDFPYDLYQAQANHQLGRLEEAASFMLKAVDADFNLSPQLPVLLLSEILDKVELWQQNARDFNEMLRNCENLAQFAHESLNNRQTALILAEISTLQGKRGQESFFPIDQNDIISMRVKARLLVVQGDFQQAAQLWTKIAELKNKDSQLANRKSYGWWQAKFYELECLTKLPAANLKDIHHIIEVLQSTYAEIPSPFAEKLDLLKQRCTIN